MSEMPEVHPLPLIVPNFEWFSPEFAEKVKNAGYGAESLEESAERAINVIDSYQREGVCVCEEQMWEVVICAEDEDENLTVSESAMKQAESLYGKPHLNGRMSFFTISEAIAVGRAAATFWAGTVECDLDGNEGQVVVAVVQGLCGREPDMKVLHEKRQWTLAAECEAGFCGEVESWVE